MRLGWRRPAAPLPPAHCHQQPAPSSLAVRRKEGGCPLSFSRLLLRFTAVTEGPPYGLRCQSHGRPQAGACGSASCRGESPSGAGVAGWVPLITASPGQNRHVMTCTQPVPDEATACQQHRSVVLCADVCAQGRICRSGGGSRVLPLCTPQPPKLPSQACRTCHHAQLMRAASMNPVKPSPAQPNTAKRT